MLVNLKTLLQDATQKKYAVGMFTTPNVPMAEAVIDAAEQINAPVIIGQAQLYDEFGPIEKYGPYFVKLAQEAKVPVCVHLDHGTSLDYIMKAIRVGYTSVMADFSTLPFEENARMVRMCVEMCHSIGVSVEGLCGRMPSVQMVATNKDLNLRDFYTKPDELQRFVELTGADAMTVSFGTIHGMKVQQPVLDLSLLKELQEASDCALVMHGSSGVEPNQLHEAITLGLRKINVYTAPSTSAESALKEAFAKTDEPYYIHELIDISKRRISEVVKDYIRIFGNGNF